MLSREEVCSVTLDSSGSLAFHDLGCFCTLDVVHDLFHIMKQLPLFPLKKTVNFITKGTFFFVSLETLDALLIQSLREPSRISLMVSLVLQSMSRVSVMNMPSLLL